MRRQAGVSTAAPQVTMARLPRFEFVGIPQHVVQRGNDRQPCFVAEEDYRRYLLGLQEASLESACRIHAYVLMTNHVHLVVTPDASRGVSRMMQMLGTRYVSWFNRRYRRTGTLWEGRFKSSLVDSERYLLTCCRYVEMNPVRAAIVESPGDYVWSSYARNAHDRPDVIVSEHPAFSALGRTRIERCDAYRQLIRESISEDDLQSIRRHIRQQRALGSSRFQAAIEAMAGRCASVRSPGRPAVRTRP